ncbi:MAG TPA: peptide chain release factor-like protein [Myxococcales bacterium]|jgi:protein subunit release factor B|nr:peptide chain release factor-like protein [Myxococcales bacterium]
MAAHDMSDDALLAQCDVQVHRAGGPGGQHRNKTETAVRLVHRPTGLVAEGKDQRSRTQNLAAALQRLREKLARRAYRPPPRHKTRPTRASQERRLESKRRASAKKRDRRRAD